MYKLSRFTEKKKEEKGIWKKNDIPLHKIQVYLLPPALHVTVRHVQNETMNGISKYIGWLFWG